MRETGAFEARKTFGALLDLVEQGEEIVILRHGKPVARLVKFVDDLDRRSRARRSAERIARLSQGCNLEGLPFKSLVDEGRP